MMLLMKMMVMTMTMMMAMMSMMTTMMMMMTTMMAMMTSSPIVGGFTTAHGDGRAAPVELQVPEEES